MRALFSGRWGDTYLFDIIIGGLKDSNKGFPKEQVEIVWDDHELSQKAAQQAESRHPTVVGRALESGEYPQLVFCAHDDLPRDVAELQRLLEWNLHGVPIYHFRHMDRETINRLLRARSAPARPPRVPRQRPLKAP